MSAIANALEMPECKEAARLAGLSGQALRDAILRYKAVITYAGRYHVRYS
jgi:hypothetical protein